jgi:hypothetical protein
MLIDFRCDGRCSHGCRVGRFLFDRILIDDPFFRLLLALGKECGTCVSKYHHRSYHFAIFSI